MKTLKKEQSPANLEYLSFGGVAVIGALIVGSMIAAGTLGTRAFCNIKAAKKVLPQVPALKATGVKVSSEDPRGFYVLLDKNNDNKPDYAVKPKESIDFEKMNGQPGSKWMNKLALSTFRELENN